MNKDVYIVDTTLRDGEQSAGKVFSTEEKLKIAKYLDKNNIYQIEAGIPAMGKEEKECIINIISERKKSLISTWNRLNELDIIESINCNPDIIHISVPTSDIQIYSNLKKDKKWIEEKIKRCIYLAKDKGYETTIGFEDASRADINYLIHLCELVEALGVKRVRYADTVGVLTLSTVKEDITKLKDNSNLDLEIHAHNDFGMALAISIEAAKSGAQYVNCTLDGIGERCGNCNLQEFIRIGRGYFNNLNDLKLDVSSKINYYKKGYV